MSQQGDAFVRRVLHGDPTPIGFGEAVQYLRQRGGSGRGAAKLAGVSESSFRRWAQGTTPKPATVDKLVQVVRGLRSRPSTMGDAGVIVPVVSQDRKRGQRERDLSGGQLRLQPGTLAAAHRIFVTTGDGDAALRRFVQGIGEPWYRAQLGRGSDNEDLVDDDEVLDSDYGMSIG